MHFKKCIKNALEPSMQLSKVNYQKNDLIRLCYNSKINIMNIYNIYYSHIIYTHK